MGKTRDLFKKIIDIKGKFHTQMSTIKDRNGKDLTEEEAIKRWKEYIGELYKKDLNDLYNHDGVVSHPEPDIPEYEVKKNLGGITTKLVEVMEFQLSYQILKDDTTKVLYSIGQKIWKTQQWPQDGKMSVFIPISKKSNAKECSNYLTTALISHASKITLKTPRATLQHEVSHTSLSSVCELRTSRV